MELDNPFSGFGDAIAGLIGGIVRTISAAVGEAVHALTSLPGPWLPVLLVGAVIVIGLALIRR